MIWSGGSLNGPRSVTQNSTRTLAIAYKIAGKFRVNEMAKVVRATVLAPHKFRLVSNLSTGLLEGDGLQKGTQNFVHLPVYGM